MAILSNYERKIVLRREVFGFLSTFGDKIGAKFSNLCGKTGQYSVPSELFQKRTSRKNRVLLSWNVVKDNNLKIEQLETFFGGVVVEFVNNDFFDEANKNNPVFSELSKRLGSDEKVSSIISIRSDQGSSSSAVPRKAYKKLINNCKISYRGHEIIVNENNYADYALRQIMSGGCGNDKWSGFIFISIRGGQQDTIETHHGQELTLFNPACEYASGDVCEDINLVMAYFALLSIDDSKYDDIIIKKKKELIVKIEEELALSEYDSACYKGNLKDYVKNHYTTTLITGQLTDPIQLSKIDISNFNISERAANSVDYTHSEAVIKDRYYWDEKKGCILSPSRPMNVFWSFHLSNMMQQNYTLDEYFEYEKERYEKRQRLIEESEID